jgi:hypothetical protein
VQLPTVCASMRWYIWHFTKSGYHTNSPSAFVWTNLLCPDQFVRTNRPVCQKQNSIFMTTVEILSLDGDGSFRANRGSETIKTVSDKKTSWGDRQVERIKISAALASRGAPWRPGATLASRGAGDALRGAGKLCERREP